MGEKKRKKTYHRSKSLNKKKATLQRRLKPSPRNKNTYNTNYTRSRGGNTYGLRVNRKKKVKTKKKTKDNEIAIAQTRTLF